eukprot:260643-Prymnesium_polylepis.1
MSARAREHAGSAELLGLRRKSVSGPGRRTTAARSGECGVRPEENELQVRKVASAQAFPQAQGRVCGRSSESRERERKKNSP